MGHRSNPFQEVPPASKGRFGSVDWCHDSRPAPGRALGRVAPDSAVSSHDCSVDKWRSLDVRCGVDRLVTMADGQCIAVHRDAQIPGAIAR